MIPLQNQNGRNAMDMEINIIKNLQTSELQTNYKDKPTTSSSTKQ